MKNIVSILLLMCAPIATSGAICPGDARVGYIHLGVNLTNQDSPNLELLRVSVVWIPSEADRRYRYQHVVDIDWVNQTHSNVDVWDGELQAFSERGIYIATLYGDTNFQTGPNFETGHVFLDTCKLDWDSGSPHLVFAYFGQDGVIEQKYTRVGFNVANKLISDAITRAFNNKLDEHMLEDIELATGVLPDHYLAQSLLFQSLGTMESFVKSNPVYFFNPKNAEVFQNRVYVTGNDASASVPLSYSPFVVLSDGINILDSDHRVRYLERHIGPLLIKAEINTGNTYGQWVHSTLVIEARLDLAISTKACVKGFTTLTADFMYPSEVSGEIRLFADDSLTEIAIESSLDMKVSCDNDYRLVASRLLENKRVVGEPIWVSVQRAEQQ